jgi:hypothetical protein
MMCEGIMLYLMLIVVFSTLAKRWYFFLILGWVPPLVPVVIGLAAGYSQYGVRNEYGDLLYCWLSTNQGVIWGFVVPMIVIIIVSYGLLLVHAAAVQCNSLTIDYIECRFVNLAYNFSTNHLSKWLLCLLK